MSKKNNNTLYHYCSLDTFLKIIKSSSIWLSDIQKSNDTKELVWFRQKYYEFILDKYNNCSDVTEKTICEIILSMAVSDGFENCPEWLLPVTRTYCQKIASTFFSLRTYAFCLSELPDSLGQWRGYAQDGKGVAIGFSKEYLNALNGYGLRCPKYNFLLGNISYKKDLTSLFNKIFELHDKSKPDEFLMHTLMDITHAAALFKHPSFKEEKEWRIIYSMDDFGIQKEDLCFDNFNKISNNKYRENFEVPNIDYIAKDSDIIPHVEIKIKSLQKAINSIVIGPKCDVSERDIRHVFLREGVINKFNDKSIKIVRSESSYK